MRRFATFIAALAVLLSVMTMNAPNAEAHAAFPGSWSYYYWTYYGNVWCGGDGRMYQAQERHQMWRYYDWNYGYWINHHDHFITAWTQHVGYCTGTA